MGDAVADKHTFATGQDKPTTDQEKPTTDQDMHTADQDSSTTDQDTDHHGTPIPRPRQVTQVNGYRPHT